MKDESTNWLSIGIGLIVLAVIGTIVVFGLGELKQAPWQFITLLGTLLVGLITFAGQFLIQVRNEQREKKVETYEKIIQFFFEVVFSIKLESSKKTENEVSKFFVEVTPRLVLWASDDVLKCFINFRQVAFRIDDENPNTNELILVFGKLLLAMRKDFGHQNQGLNERSILGIVITDIENL